MQKPNLAKIVKNTRVALDEHAPEILMGFGIAGMFATTVFAVNATPKALKLIEEAKAEKEDELTPVETVKAAWKPYIPTAIMFALSTACLVGSNSVSTRRTAALAAAYQISETALSEYREKVVETIGEKKERNVREKIAQDQLDKNPVSKSEVIITGKGDTLFWDYISKRYFRFNIDKLRKIENQLNKQMIHDICGYVSLNDLYDEIPNLDRVEYGDDIGWNALHQIDFDIYPGMTEDEEPCLVLGHHNAPKYGYDK